MLKSIAKRIVREEHWSFLSWYRDRFGLFSSLLAYANLLRKRGIGCAPNYLNGSFVSLRPGTGDQTVYDEIFIAREYDLDLGNPLSIIDAGAHIGLSSVYFAGNYPGATVIAVEPEISNFNMLLRNAKGYPNIKPVRAGLWSRKAHLRVQNPKANTWSFRVTAETSTNGIPAHGIRDIMANFNITQIDVLKMDIEGSELEVLTHSHSWIDSVKTLIIELHDRFQPGCQEALATAVRNHTYMKRMSGENIIITDLKRIGT